MSWQTWPLLLSQKQDWCFYVLQVVFMNFKPAWIGFHVRFHDCIELVIFGQLVEFFTALKKFTYTISLVYILGKVEKQGSISSYNHISLHKTTCALVFQPFHHFREALFEGEGSFFNTKFSLIYRWYSTSIFQSTPILYMKLQVYFRVKSFFGKVLPLI